MRSILHRFLSDAILDRVVLGGTVEQWLMLLLALGAAGLFWIGFRRLIAWRTQAVSDGKSIVGTTAWAGRIVTDVLERTRGYFLFAVALFLAARVVGWNEQGQSATTWLLVFAAIFQTGRWASGVLTLYLDRYKARNLETDRKSVV